MPDDGKLKSAYEIAMEKLRSRDREQGVEDDGPLTEDQIEAIEEVRRDAKAKLAELEILRASRQAEAAGDPQKLAEFEEQYRTDRERVESRRDSAIARIRRGD